MTRVMYSGGHEGADDADHHEDLVVAGAAELAGTGEDLVLRPEAGQREDADERGRGDDEGLVGVRHPLPQPAHVLLHVEAVHGVADRARAEEQAGLEEGVGEEVEEGGRPRPDAERHDHVAELGHRRVGEHLLDVVLHERQAGPAEDRDAADDGEQVDARRADAEALEEDAVEAPDHVDAGHDHGGGVDQGGHRGRAGHGVGQPGVEDELARLRHDRRDERARRDQQRQVADARRRAPSR